MSDTSYSCVITKSSKKRFWCTLTDHWPLSYIYLSQNWPVLFCNLWLLFSLSEACRLCGALTTFFCTASLASMTFWRVFGWWCIFVFCWGTFSGSLALIPRFCHQLCFKCLVAWSPIKINSFFHFSVFCHVASVIWSPASANKKTRVLITLGHYQTLHLHTKHAQLRLPWNSFSPKKLNNSRKPVASDGINSFSCLKEKGTANEWRFLM